MDYKKLPTAEEYLASISIETVTMKEWSEPRYQCPKCDGGMCKDLMRVCTSLPPRYMYKCNKCGHVEYQFG